VGENFLVKEKRGRDNFYINQRLFDLLSDKNNTKTQLKKYKGISGNNGITAYRILEKGIMLEFQYKDLYLYDYIKPGKKHVDQMKILAESGRGLTTYVNQNVRENYKEKIK
jgi:DNA-binding Xre family transcriptional regulator